MTVIGVICQTHLVFFTVCFFPPAKNVCLIYSTKVRTQHLVNLIVNAAKCVKSNNR